MSKGRDRWLLFRAAAHMFCFSGCCAAMWWRGPDFAGLAAVLATGVTLVDPLEDAIRAAKPR